MSKFLLALRSLPLVTGLIEAKKDGKLSVQEIFYLLENFLSPLARIFGYEVAGETPQIAPELQQKVSEAKSQAELLEQILE